MNKKKKDLQSINLFFGLILVAITIFSCNNEETGGNEKPYDASKPVTLETFYPDSGGIATKMIIKGENFGTDIKKVKVYYNKKQAAVVRANGDMLYVITPRQPGDTCNISVVIDKDSASFSNTFKYTTQITVTTIAGKPGGDGSGTDGTLAEATFNRPRFVAVDAERNIFVSEFVGNRVRQINEEANLVTTLIKDVSNPNAPSVDAEGKKVFVPLDNGADGFIEFDPETQWTGKKMKPRKVEGTPDFTLDWQHSLAPNLKDQLIYTRAYNGTLISFNARTKAAQVVDVNLMSSSDSFLAFDPFNPNILYLCYTAKHCIYTYDLDTKEHKLFAGEQNVAGWADGEREDAQFRTPRQITFDKDGILYVADSDNHCIRTISREGIVTTVIGIAGVKGYVDGTPDDALFNSPCGVAVDDEGTIYVGDAENSCIRKLAIQ